MEVWRFCRKESVGDVGRGLFFFFIGEIFLYCADVADKFGEFGVF